MSNSSPQTIKLSEEMQANLKNIGYDTLTPIQQESLVHSLKGRDILAWAKTGSGKTAAFGIALLERLDVKNFRAQSLILCPTRELAEQVAKELRLLAKFKHNIKVLTLCGGVAFGPQLGSLAHGAHIVVGTPGRILKHLQKGSLSLDNLTSLVLDEADRMLDMGFLEEIEAVLSFVPPKRQTLLFSATYPDEVISLASKIQHDAVVVKTEHIEVPNDLDERFIATDEKDKALLAVLAHFDPANAIIFCNTKAACDEVSAFLQNNRIDALSLHGDLEQYDRVDVLVQFTNASARVLVATDVAARGLDIKELSLVVNYDVPFLEETYTHRVGRTARAGASGVAITLVGSAEEERAELMACENLKRIALESLEAQKGYRMLSPYRTIVIEGGKKDKLRAGDILGALTKECGVEGRLIGKIDIYEKQSYVAIIYEEAEAACEKLKRARIKSKKFPIWML